MKLSNQCRFIAVFVFVVVGLTLIWGIHNAMEQSRSLEAVTKLGFAIDTSPDALQRDLRITFALLLGAMALWSRRGALIALITALAVFVGIEITTWFIAQGNTFDRTEIEYHFLAATLIGIAIVLWLRGANYLVIAILGPAYVLLESASWYLSTIRMRALLGVDQLQPPTRLNNVFYGAHWWHLAIMTISVLMVFFGIRAVRNKNSTEKTS